MIIDTNIPAMLITFMVYACIIIPITYVLCYMVRLIPYLIHLTLWYRNNKKGH